VYINFETESQRYIYGISLSLSNSVRVLYCNNLLDAPAKPYKLYAFFFYLLLHLANPDMDAYLFALLWNFSCFETFFFVMVYKTF
jgi:hypothetical protein